MPDKIQIIAVAGSLCLFIFILELVRRRRLRVEYSILWLAAAIVVMVLSIFRSLLEGFAGLVGVFYAPAALFLVAIFFGIVLFIHFSIVMTRLANENTTLAQRIALLEAEVEKERTGNSGG